jgi:DNA processing protein
MADQRETAALVALLRRGSRSSSAYASMVEEAGSALVVLERERDSGRLDLQYGLLDELDPLEAIVEAISNWRQAGFDLLTVLDEGYPASLRAVHDRPPLIFIAGSLAEADDRSVSVVGARGSTPHGEQTAREVAAALVAQNFVVVSGLAAGIDTAVHHAAIDAGGRTIAVIGTGLEFVYPPENADLQRRIAREHAVVSRFWPDAGPSKRTFPMRNGVMAGLTLATVIIEASETSGTRIQARLALAQGRPVLLWHALLDQAWARELSLRPGTHVVRSADEVGEVVDRLSSAGTLVP